MTLFAKVFRYLASVGWIRCEWNRVFEIQGRQLVSFRQPWKVTFRFRKKKVDLVKIIKCDNFFKKTLKKFIFWVEKLNFIFEIFIFNSVNKSKPQFLVNSAKTRRGKIYPQSFDRLQPRMCRYHRISSRVL